MIKHFIYTKKDNSVSERYVHQISAVDDKMLTIDLTEFDVDEREEYEDILNHIHAQYIQAIKEVGLGEQFRYFFLDKVQDV